MPRSPGVRRLHLTSKKRNRWRSPSSCSAQFQNRRDAGCPQCPAGRVSRGDPRAGSRPSNALREHTLPETEDGYAQPQAGLLTRVHRRSGLLGLRQWHPARAPPSQQRSCRRISLRSLFTWLAPDTCGSPLFSFYIPIITRFSGLVQTRCSGFGNRYSSSKLEIMARILAPQPSAASSG